MTPIDLNTIPKYFWDNLRERGDSDAYVELDPNLLADAKYWVTEEVEPDFPRPGYSRRRLNMEGDLRRRELYKNRFVPGYWTLQHVDANITCFASLNDVEHYLMNRHEPIFGLVNPKGQRCKITAVPYAD